MNLSFPKNNNLEWLRLGFALQVVISHIADHFGIYIPEVLAHFPGVPAFFFVSGFLIYASYLNSPSLFIFFENRFLRLYPGLVFVAIGGIFVVLFAIGWDDLWKNSSTYVFWFFAQTTLFQAYNPAAFRNVGVGVINGSLWTISVEILFYICVPLIVWMERRFRLTVVIILVLSFVFYAAGPYLFINKIYRDKTFYDVLSLTPIVWGWMFAFGIISVKYFNVLKRWLKYIPFLMVPLVCMIIFGSGFLFNSRGNNVGLFYFINYIALVFWLAFATPFLNLKIDLSYGLYIWHMPIINILLVLAIPNIWLAIFLVFSMAVVSWFLVEKPALKLKHHSLKAIST